MKLLVNNVEQSQPQESNETLIHLFGRHPDNPKEREEVVVRGTRPYFYARKSEVESKKDFLLAQDVIEEIQETDEDGNNFRGLMDDVLVRIYTPYPQDVSGAKEYFDKTWAADVPFTRRFLIDSEVRDVVEVPDTRCDLSDVEPVRGGGSDRKTPFQNITPRTVTFDIEVDDRGDTFPSDGDEAILSIVSHDNYRGDTVGFITLPERDAEETFPNGGPDNIDTLYAYDDERAMLDDFASWLSDVDPDLITGWNVADFDVKYLIERMETIGVDPSQMSPMGWAGVTRGGEPRIKGRTVYDLLTVYKKNSFTELRSYSLDNVAEAELGEDKIHFDGSYYDLYQNDPSKFLEYNAHDTELTYRINQEAGTIKFRDVLRREVGVTFEDSYDNKDFVDMMCRRKLRELGRVGPTRPDYGDEPDEDFEGALVLSPFSGVTQNVVGIDLASLYPYTMAMFNASPETKVPESNVFENDGELWGRDGSDIFRVCRAANGQHFRLDKDGLFKQLVDEAISLKSEYKEKRNNAETEEEYEKWASKYSVAKTITNSIYGVTGWVRFFLYDKDVAEAVTLSGQEVTKRTASYVEETGYDVIYGDTDSCYIKFPDDWDREACLHTARELCTDLNQTVYPELAAEHHIPRDDNLWDIEAEAYMLRYFQAGKKKRYAYLATWKDGHTIEDPEPTVSGFSSKRSDSAALTKETEERVLNEILSGNEEAVSEIVYEAAKEISQDDPDYDRIGIPGGLQKKLTDDPEKGDSDSYYSVSCKDSVCHPQDAHPRAAWNANKVLNLSLGEGSKPKRVYLQPRVLDGAERQLDTIAFEREAELEPIKNEMKLNRQRMTEVLLIRPLERILAAVGVDANAAVKGQSQSGLADFV